MNPLTGNVALPNLVGKWVKPIKLDTIGHPALLLIICNWRFRSKNIFYQSQFANNYLLLALGEDQ